MLVIYRCLTRIIVTRSCSTSARRYHCTDYRIPMQGVPHVILLLSSLHGIHWLLLHMHVWFLYSCHMDSRSCYMYYCSMLRIHVIWLLSVTDMDIPVTGHESCWYATCGIPHLLFPFPVILFPFPFILFYAINIAQVQLSCYSYHVL